MTSDLLWTIVSFMVTILVLSYIIGDNPLFRLTTYIFIGVSAGYVAVLLIYQVIWPRLVLPLWNSEGNLLILLVPILLSILLLFKLFPRVSFIGNIPMGFLVGAGAAVAIGGAVTGTLFGQMEAAILPFDLSEIPTGGRLVQLIGGIFLLLGTVSSLAYFHFSARSVSETQTNRRMIPEILAKIGSIFIAITLGAIFAGVLSAALTALIERLDFIWSVVQTLFL